MGYDDRKGKSNATNVRGGTGGGGGGKGYGGGKGGGGFGGGFGGSFGDRDKGKGKGKGKKDGKPAVYVGGLSFDTTTEGLESHFSAAGEVTYARVMTDRDTGRSRGCGKVEFASEDAMENAIQQFNQTDFDGRTISVRAFT